MPILRDPALLVAYILTPIFIFITVPKDRVIIFFSLFFWIRQYMIKQYQDLMTFIFKTVFKKVNLFTFPAR